MIEGWKLGLMSQTISDTVDCPHLSSRCCCNFLKKRQHFWFTLAPQRYHDIPSVQYKCVSLQRFPQLEPFIPFHFCTNSPNLSDLYYIYEELKTWSVQHSWVEWRRREWKINDETSYITLCREEECGCVSAAPSINGSETCRSHIRLS